jgi:hypothetical protein
MNLSKNITYKFKIGENVELIDNINSEYSFLPSPSIVERVSDTNDQSLAFGPPMGPPFELIWVIGYPAGIKSSLYKKVKNRNKLV